MQWLEGTKEEIATLMLSIKQDPRHFDLHVLSDVEDMRERIFPEWTMNFVNADEITDVLSRALRNAKDVGSIQALRSLLKQINLGGLSSLTRH